MIGQVNEAIEWIGEVFVELSDRRRQIESLAKEVMDVARDQLVMNLRFLDMALSKLIPVPTMKYPGVAADDSHFYYDPAYLLRCYKKETASVTRMLLHSLLHCIFFHSFGYEKLDARLWGLSCDMAVEQTILSMKLPGAEVRLDAERAAKLAFYEKEAYGLTAEKLYKYFRYYPPSEEELEMLERLFLVDQHDYWIKEQTMEISLEQWKKISERVKADMKSFSKDRNGAQALEQNLEEATRTRYDYRAFLKKFVVRGEDIRINDDEFDYIFYTYGLTHYENMPLVEPLEYSEVHKIRDFIIAIDTSASCRGKIVQAFLRMTMDILLTEDTFFEKCNVHIIQCDNEIQSDDKITCKGDFEDFLKSGKLKGFGSTDFRPVFSYVQKLQEQGEFEDLRGLLYFTDGYGIYPEKRPEYDVVFVYLDEDERRIPVPPWAIKLIIESESLEDITE